jgi:hypothetical protein
MRTTVEIDDALLERAKRLALKEKQTLGAVLSEALAAYLAGRKVALKDPPFELIVRGSPDARFPTTGEIQAVEDEEDSVALRMPGLKRDVTP